jgi:hypothetical protein
MSTKAGKAGGISRAYGYDFGYRPKLGAHLECHRTDREIPLDWELACKRLVPFVYRFRGHERRLTQLITSTIAQVTHWNVIPTGDRAILTSMTYDRSTVDSR